MPTRTTSIVVIAPNSALDEVFRVRRGRVIRHSVFAGGKGANAAHAAALLGARVTLVGFAGGARGREFARRLRARGVRGRLVPCRGETRRTFCILDAAGADPLLMVEEGSAVTASEARRFERAAIAAMKGAHAVVIAGSMPPGMSPETYRRLARAADRRAIPVVVDARGAPLAAAAAVATGVLSINEDELAEAIAQRRLRELRVGLGLCVKCGERGVRFSSGELGGEARELEVVGDVERGNPTGSGDVITGHLAVAVAKLASIEAALPRAVAAAGANLRHDEPAAFTPAQVRSRLPRVVARYVAPSVFENPLNHPRGPRHRSGDGRRS